LLLGAVLLLGIGISSLLHLVRSDFRAYQPGSSISVSEDGYGLYVERDTTGVDGLRCAATGPNGRVVLPRDTGRGILTNSQGSFFTIASTPKDLPTGQYVISCVSPSTGVETPLYLGPRFDLAAVGRGVALSIIAPMLLGVCSVVLFAILALLRFRSRRVATSGV
jgi:hypothetical protein